MAKLAVYEFGQQKGGRHGTEGSGYGRDGSFIHLWVEDAGRRLNNTDSLVEDLHRVESVLIILHDCHELQTQVLWVHLCCEVVGDRLLLASWNLDTVALSGEVAEDLRRPLDGIKGTADEGKRNWVRLRVGDGDDGLGWVAVDQLHTEDFRLREGCGDGDFEIRRLGHIFIDLFLN